jgi:prefoldin subunit 5
MATANTTSPRSTKAAKPSAKSSAARRGSTSASARSQSTKAKATKAKATDRRSASTRSVHQAQSALRQTETATRNTVDVFGDYTERAVLIPVGAALIARERVVSTVNDAISSYGSTTKAQAQLRRFERRGNTARNRLRKARVRFERELRQRRRELEKTVSSLEDRRDAVAKNVTELPNRVQERILSLV